ncbi:MAG: peptidylprolyl isomerase [Flavobacteriales bacterium]|nr:peptidylprolyl isomerase [Flavobacteriales bacterium]
MNSRYYRIDMKRILTVILASFISLAAVAQDEPQTIDKVIAVVGGNITLQSELETQYLQMLASGYSPDDDSRCIIFEELLYGNLLLHRAKVDSLNVSDGEVEDELSRRLEYFIAQLGSQEKLEEYYEKSILEIKDEFRELIKEQLLSQRMQQQITGDIKVTPAETRAYFNKIPKDSLPYINTEIEIGKIMRRPEITKEQRATARAKAEELRDRVVNGESFRALAILYSEDPGSSKNGGDLGFFTRGMMVPEFDAVAFRLKEDSISDVFETSFGFHFMEMLERRGEQINVRHILIRPKTSEEDLEKARVFLDSIHGLIDAGKITFAAAAEKFSDDEESKLNGGMMFNPMTGAPVFDMDQLGSIDQRLFLTIEDMQPGDISKAVKAQSPDGKESYNLYYLKSRTEPHVANMKDDYQKIQQAALAEKKTRVIEKWINDKAASTYIRIDDSFKDCPFAHRWDKN